MLKRSCRRLRRLLLVIEFVSLSQLVNEKRIKRCVKYNEEMLRRSVIQESGLFYRSQPLSGVVFRLAGEMACSETEFVAITLESCITSTSATRTLPV